MQAIKKTINARIFKPGRSAEYAAWRRKKGYNMKKIIKAAALFSAALILLNFFALVALAVANTTDDLDLTTPDATTADDTTPDLTTSDDGDVTTPGGTTSGTATTTAPSSTTKAPGSTTDSDTTDDPASNAVVWGILIAVIVIIVIVFVVMAAKPKKPRRNH